MARTARARPAETASQTITSFTRISKGSGLLLNDPLGKKSVSPTTIVALPSRKRKAVEDEEASSQTRREAARITQSAATKRTCRRDEAPLSTPPKALSTVVKGKPAATVKTSSTKRAHKPSASTILSQANNKSKTVQSKIDASFKKAAAEVAKKNNLGLPPHLVELVQLNKAFVKTLLLQFAHNGSQAPIDVHILAPNVSRSWGKRQVNVEDIRRCIALQTSQSNNVASPFIISDYGRGKICVEFRQGQEGTTKVNEDQLCKQFLENLRSLCAERATDEMVDVQEISLDKLSLADLPKVDITDMNNGASANPLLSKGQRALAELKNGIAAKQQQKESKQVSSNTAAMLNPDGSKMSLLDRLRVKQLAKASGPQPPSGPELERRAALNRVGDVKATIAMLSLSNPMSLPRQAFTMNAIIEKLKDSLRVPVSKEEGTACVRLIATEVAPEWLKVVMIGGRENVVVQRSAQPGDSVIHERVKRLLG